MNNLYSHLKDEEFLKELYKAKIKIHYAKIILLSFDEKPIKEIHGIITSGSLSVNGSSAIRRTINLSMAAAEDNNDLTNIDNYISINKKIKVELGLKNPFKYNQYEDILWFPIGIFVLSTANLSRSTSGYNISITGKDKMSKLDGTVGGTLPSTVTFHEYYEEDTEGNVIIKYPTIYQIILEAVNHYGEEDLQNIFIDDLDEKAQILIKYVGSDNIYFNQDYSGFTYEDKDGSHKILPYQNVGYRITDLTYPGELVLSGGETVSSLLDKIAKTLGNFEYFYDVEGKFHFQEIKNYINTGTLIIEDGISTFSYFTEQNTNEPKYILDEELKTQININPKYDNIKNDFIVWGEKTSATGKKIPIRYHVAIKDKPYNNLINKYCYYMDRDNGDLKTRKIYYTSVSPTSEQEGLYTVNEIVEENNEKILVLSTSTKSFLPLRADLEFYIDDVNKAYSPNYLCSKFTIQDITGEKIVYENKLGKKITVSQNLVFPEDFYDFKNITNNHLFSQYRFNENDQILFEFKLTQIESNDTTNINYLAYRTINNTLEAKKVFGPSPNGGWREELYRQALLDQQAGTLDTFEQAELIAEWRKLYDSENKEWEDKNNPNRSGWNPAVFDDPGSLEYWLDYIDLPKYSIEAIGRRSKIVTNNEISVLWEPIIPPVIFYDQYESNNYKNIRDGGYQAFQLTPGDLDMFVNSGTGITALDNIRALVRQYLSYNTSITVNCLPIYHMEPNNLIYIFDKKTGINDNYLVSQFTVPLTYNGTMSITATEVVVKY